MSESEEGEQLEDQESEDEIKENSSNKPFILQSPPKRPTPISLIKEIQSDLEAMETALAAKYRVKASFRDGEMTNRSFGRGFSRGNLLVDEPISLVKAVSPRPSRRLIPNTWR